MVRFTTSLIALASLAPLLMAGDGTSSFRFLVPAYATVEAQAPVTPVAFEDASRRQGTDFGVKIELEVSRSGAPFRTVPLTTPICNGDHIAFRFTPTAAGYASIVNRGTSGTWSQIWPSRSWEDNSFGPDRPVRLPTQEGSGFPVSGPSGKEHIMLFFSPGAFSTELKQLMASVLGGETPSVAAANAPRIGLMRDLDAAEAVHVVGQGEQTVAFSLEHRDHCPALP